MKKQFENIDDLFLSKINNLDDSDVEINEHLIWKDIESQLVNKKSIRILWWKYASVACMCFLLGFGYIQVHRKENSTTDLVIKNPIYTKTNPILVDNFVSKEVLKNINQVSKSQLVTNKINRNKHNIINSFQLPESRNNFREVAEGLTSRKLFLLSGSSNKSEVGTFIEPLNSINIQKAEIVFTPTEIKPVEVNLPKKLRVMHIEDFQIQPIDRISQPKTFYVFFNKEFNIDSQLPSVSIAHPNNIN